MPLSSSSPLRVAAAVAMRKDGFDPEFSSGVIREVEAIVAPSADRLAADTRDLRSLLVRGRMGLARGDDVDVVLLTADPVRGFIDFARE